MLEGQTAVERMSGPQRGQCEKVKRLRGVLKGMLRYDQADSDERVYHIYEQ